MWTNFSCQPGEPLVTRLLRCWDIEANGVTLDGKAKQLRSLSWDVGIDQGIGKRPKTLNLCRQLLSSVRERYLCTEDLSACISSMERLTKDFWNLKEEIKEGHQKLKEEIKEEMSHAPPVQTRVSAIRSRHPTAQERGYTPQASECRSQFAFTWRGVQYTWNRLPPGWKYSPTLCHRLIQTAQEKGEAPEHLQYIDDIIVWGNIAKEVFEKGEKITQVLLKSSFTIKQTKVKGPAKEIQFSGVKWQDGHHQIPVDVVNKIAAMSPPTSKKEAQVFLGIGGCLEDAYYRVQSDCKPSLPCDMEEKQFQVGSCTTSF
ncbi:hypothetical protein BTVI_72480 [Pitangus sulphuratus]|nr:hypothetical protein BTVI_72480 [Pitangus sulphuratus]